jgi:hypothetical protein
MTITTPMVITTMVRRFVLVVLGSVGVFLGATSSQAHHSVAAGFDMDLTVEIVGTVAGMEWRNPHAQLTVEAKDENDQVQEWSVWFGSANSLRRRGWKTDDLPVGETVTVTGFQARDGSLQLYGGGQTTLPDGRQLFGGDAPTDGN